MYPPFEIKDWFNQKLIINKIIFLQVYSNPFKNLCFNFSLTVNFCFVLAYMTYIISVV